VWGVWELCAKFNFSVNLRLFPRMICSLKETIKPGATARKTEAAWEFKASLGYIVRPCLKKKKKKKKRKEKRKTKTIYKTTAKMIEFLYTLSLIPHNINVL
jgi:hypothetical protein